MNPFAMLISSALEIYSFLIFAYVVMQLLFHFNILNKNQQYVIKALYFLQDVCEPVLKKIRKVVPPVSNIDITPAVLLFAISMVKYFVVYYLG